jgi:DNA-binding MarR family transcriptional regulator
MRDATSVVPSVMKVRMNGPAFPTHAEATFLLAPSLSRILPELEARELIRRRQPDSDLRRAVVSLEPKGLKLIAAHAPDSEEIYASIARSFGQERLDQLFTLLRELEETLAAADATPRRSRHGGDLVRNSGRSHRKTVRLE